MGEATPAGVLDGLARHPYSYARARVAANPSTPAAALAVLSSDECSDVVFTALTNPSCPPGALQAAYGRGVAAALMNPSCPPGAVADAYERGASADAPADAVGDALVAARHPNLPTALVGQACHHPDPRVRGAAAKNPSLPAEHATALLADDVKGVRFGVLSNPACPPGALQAAAVASEADAILVASNPSTPPEVLARLASGPAPLPGRVASNPSTPPEVLEVLAEDGDDSVRAAVRANPACPAGVRFGDAFT